jgi:hypothetical protein
MSTALIPVDQVERMAVAVAKSNLFGVKTPDQAMALMLIAQAEGMHPAIAARDYHVINGRPTLKADAMLARFQQAGGKVEWSDYTDQRVIGTFSHPKGGSVTIEWTVEMGRKAGLLGNQTWTKYPRQMLRSRCISEGIRTVFPGVVVGTYSEEEGQDMAPQTIVRDMGNAEEVAAPAPAIPATPAVDVDALIKTIKSAATREFLELLRPQMRRVPKGKERDRVVAAVQRRADEIDAEQAPRAEQAPPVDAEIIDAEEGAV